MTLTSSVVKMLKWFSTALNQTIRPTLYSLLLKKYINQQKKLPDIINQEALYSNVFNLFLELRNSGF